MSSEVELLAPRYAQNNFSGLSLGPGRLKNARRLLLKRRRVRTGRNKSRIGAGHWLWRIMASVAIR